MLWLYDQPPKTTFARRLRRRQTSGEIALWRKLRAYRFYDLKFRRQVPIGPFVVDFLCFEKMLIVEVDGESHFQPGAQARDARREAWLCASGFRIFRCTNRRAVYDTDVVLREMAEMLGLV